MFYDGGSPENEGGLGTKNLYKIHPTTMFELVEGYDLVSQAKLWVWKPGGNAGKSN
ncbi:hypothetical protein [Paenibacillus polymyxa]|uniref:hypothetical protein n=1 Tax=Paenibacillus TaxID=44249 RepID=UPI000AD1EDDE|nr:hypothetical protein [Paenibacillus polymyxa]MCF2720387.1 hypothetical protein [Paenibacillus sp. UKAQ_18]MDY8119848.1 hypothetical protein [Paenibacillus polymyxa]